MHSMLGVMGGALGASTLQHFGGAGGRYTQHRPGANEDLAFNSPSGRQIRFHLDDKLSSPENLSASRHSFTASNEGQEQAVGQSPVGEPNMYKGQVYGTCKSEQCACSGYTRMAGSSNIRCDECDHAPLMHNKL